MKQHAQEPAPYAITSCRPQCPNAVLADPPLAEIEKILLASGWPSFLTSTLGVIRHHHQFRIAVALCPNGCSRPHIADFGLIATARIAIDPEQCQACGACVSACQEQALSLTPAMRLDETRCLGCQACIRTCPISAIRTVATGFRIVLGGKLGRHPRLAHELGFFSTQQALTILDRTLAVLIKDNQPGRRLGELIETVGTETFNALVRP